MTRKSILLGLGAVGALALAGNAGAQIVGGAVGGVTGQGSAAGQVAAPMSATPAVPATRTPAIPATPAVPSAASAGADASASASSRSDFPSGMVVRDSAGVQIGTVMAPDPSVDMAGRVRIKTGAGFITVPRGSLMVQGDVAVSKQSAAELRASAKAKTE